MATSNQSKGTVVITGGAGYIGSFASAELFKAGYRVVVVDNLSVGHREAVPPEIQLEQVDLSDRAGLRDVLRRTNADGVIHFAALTQVGESVQQPSRYWDTNVMGTKNLLDAMMETGVGKLIFSSTAATYGNPVGTMNENHPQSPINPYGHSKLAMEFLIRDYVGCPAMSLRACALRYFNACGAAADGSRGEDHAPETHLVPHVVAAALGYVDDKRGFKGKLTVFGDDYDTRDGTCERDYVNIEDLARAHLVAYENLQDKGERYFDAFNVGTSSGHTVKEVIETAQRVVAEEAGKEQVEIPYTVGPRREGDPARLVADAAKLQQALGWRPHNSLADSIRSVTKWMVSHPKGYESPHKRN